MDKEQAFYWAIDKRIAQIYRLHVFYQQIIKKLQEEYDWKDNDLRLTLFRQISDLLYQNTLSYRLGRSGALNEEWMNESMPREEEYDEEELQTIFDEAVGYINTSAWLISYSTVRDKLHQVLKKITGEEGKEPGTVSKIATEIHEQLQSDFPLRLFRLFDRVESCIWGTTFYSAGHFSPKSLMYRQQEYDFSGGRLKFDTYVLLLNLLEDIAGVYVNIVRTEQVRDWSFTWDPHYRK